MKILEYKGYRFINLTPHPLVFRDGVELEVYDQELVKKILGTPVEIKVDKKGIFVQTIYKQNSESLKILQFLNDSGFTVISSIINAQTYPGLCVSPIITKETMRSPPEEKRMEYKFNIFLKI